jgi:hypothetical protein
VIFIGEDTFTSDKQSIHSIGYGLLLVGFFRWFFYVGFAIANYLLESTWVFWDIVV